MKRKSVNILIIIGLLFILAALSLAGYNMWTDMKASVRSNEALQQMEFGAGSFEWKSNPQMEMPVTEIDGVIYVGALEVPSLGLQLPVAAYWDEAFAKAAPCKYTGSPYTGDMIIAGHNYRQHFGKLRNLQPGSDVYFTDLSGNTFRYTVVSIETVDGADTEGMKAGSNSSSAVTDSYSTGIGWDLTLFTCNFSGQARIAVRCVEK